MSNQRRIRRNMQVFMGRAQAEVSNHGPGVYQTTVKHDDWCPGLKRQSMLLCTCKPEISAKKVM